MSGRLGYRRIRLYILWVDMAFEACYNAFAGSDVRVAGAKTKPNTGPRKY